LATPPPSVEIQPGVVLNYGRLNRVPNYSVENGLDWPDDWYHSETGAYWADVPRTGFKSLLLDVTDATADWRCKAFQVLAGEVYTLQAWVKGEAVSGEFFITVRWWRDLAATNFISEDNIPIPIGSYPDWRLFEASFKAPAEAVAADVLFRCPTPSTGKVYADDFALLTDWVPQYRICLEQQPIPFNLTPNPVEVYSSACCVHPDVDVITNFGVERIAEVRPGTRVLTHEGSFQQVIAKCSRDYDGTLIKIKPRYFPEIKVTPEHPILCIKGELCRIPSYRRQGLLCKPTCHFAHQCKEKFFQKYKLEWRNAESIGKDCFLVVPRVTRTIDIPSLSIKEFLHDLNLEVHSGVVFKLGKRPNTKVFRKNMAKIPNEIEISKEFMLLAGYFISEGYANVKNAQIQFDFGSHEMKLALEAKRLLKKVFNVNAKITMMKQVIRVRAYSVILSNLFKRLFGEVAPTKKMPDWFIFLPKEKQLALLKGIYRGDGTRQKRTTIFSTTSKKLAFQIATILLRLGMFPSITKGKAKRTKIEGRGVKCLPLYDIRVHGASLASIDSNLDTPRVRRKYHYGWFEEKWAVVPIRKIDKEEYRGKVFNLEVEKDATYTLNFISVHNCYIYEGIQFYPLTVDLTVKAKDKAEVEVFDADHERFLLPRTEISGEQTFRINWDGGGVFEPRIVGAVDSITLNFPVEKPKTISPVELGTVETWKYSLLAFLLGFAGGAGVGYGFGRKKR
jgi:intein/homing endonuclease